VTGATGALNVSFTLGGDLAGNTTDIDNINAKTTITAQVTSSNDLSKLAEAINDRSATTGIQARVGSSKAELIVTSDDGRDIVISGFDGGTGVTAAVQGQTLNDDKNLDGGLLKDIGPAVTLNQNDSARVGGYVKMESSGGINVKTGGDTTLLAQDNNNSELFDVASIDVSNIDGASNAISILDASIQQVNDLRASLGAVQNRLSSTVANLESSSENLQFSNSRVRDADVAMESSELARAQVLMQAGVSVLAQANQQPQMALKLLG